MSNFSTVGLNASIAALTCFSEKPLRTHLARRPDSRFLKTNFLTLALSTSEKLDLEEELYLAEESESELELELESELDFRDRFYLFDFAMLTTLEQKKI